MGKAGVGTAKYQSKQLKAAGLQKLRFYCQLCLKQCRDANGFKNHLNAPSHVGRIANLSKDGTAGRTLADFLARFERDFLRLLRINHGTKKVAANKYYQEYILNDKDHVHMNATRWSSLTAFVKYLGTGGKVRVEIPDEDEFDLCITYVDKTVHTGEREKSLKSDEDMSMKFLQAQVAAGENDTRERGSECLAAPEEAAAPAPVSLSLKGLRAKKETAKSVFESDSDPD